jgi:3-hydroxyisobutyrate dehydrogenase-like beta-hydroxyacid dehydrogenase
MGLPILGHLVRHGHEVRAFDISEDRRTVVEDAGAAWCDDAADLARESEFILICVGYDRDVTDLTLRDNGLLDSAKQGSVIAIISTVLPETVEELATLGQEKDISVVDAAVCRGSWFADEGTLLSFIGGSAEVFARLKDVVSAYPSDIVHSGGPGTSQVCKAANTLVLSACLIADHEAVALADRYGVDIEVLRQALLTSSATNGALTLWGKQTMAWAEDDMVIVGAMANGKNIGLPQAGLNREICRSLLPRRYDLAQYGV